MKTEKDQWTRIINDFIAGSAAGFASVLCCHPFDTLKVSLSDEATEILTFQIG